MAAKICSTRAQICAMRLIPLFLPCQKKMVARLFVLNAVAVPRFFQLRFPCSTRVALIGIASRQVLTGSSAALKCWLLWVLAVLVPRERGEVIF